MGGPFTNTSISTSSLGVSGSYYRFEFYSLKLTVKYLYDTALEALNKPEIYVFFF